MGKAKRKRGRPPVDEISERQRRTLKGIERFIRNHQYPPTIAELAASVGINVATAHDQVKRLERKGYLKRDCRKARGLTVIRKADEPVSELIEVPVVGSVAAGYPILADENIIDTLMVESSIANKDRCFALTVEGRSMTKAGIHDGDLVIVRQQPLAETGDIVVALVDGEATVKRLFISEQTIELRPENSRHKPIAVGPDVDLRILGKVVGVRRRSKR